MGDTRPARPPLARTPFPRDHIIQLYTDEQAFLRTLARYVARGLEAGEAAVVIAEPRHMAALTRRLVAAGVRPKRDGGFVTVDARSCLAKFMENGMPRRAVFRSVVSRILDRIEKAGYPKIRLFGEMVNILWQRNPEAALRLEELWTELIAEYQVCLLCAYRLEAAERRAKAVLLHRITRLHNGVRLDGGVTCDALGRRRIG